MKSLTLTLLISLTGLFSPSVLAQNFQTFKSSDIHYFRENNEGLMLASQIESSEFLAGDSIFHPFTSFRVGGPGDLIETPGWMGEKIILKEDGINLFFNQNSDTIFIDTQAEIGDSFTFYKYESGATIEATVSSIVEVLVFDILDSVKTYVLTSDEPSFDFESPSFRIGKVSGLLDIYPFYSFPQIYEPIYGPNTVLEKYELVGQLYPRKGITKPTYLDMNNLEVGDVVQNKSYYPEHLITKRHTILSKAYLDAETVEYEIERYQNIHFNGVSEEFPGYDSLSTVIYLDTLSISDIYVTEQLIPEKDYGEGTGDYTFALHYNEPCGYHEAFESLGSQREEGDFIGTIFEPVKTTKSVFSKSLQSYSTYYHYTGADLLDYGSIFQSSIVSGVECGEGVFLTIEKQSVKPHLSIYPNPSKGDFTIDIDGEFDLDLFSLDGKLVYSKKKQDASNRVAVNSLQNGTYLLVITQNGIVYYNKVVISK